VDRTDDAYYAPLRDIDLDPVTDIFLGLLHDDGGAMGNKLRLSAASKVLNDFGIAAECGLGRRRQEDIAKILMLQGQVSRSKQG